MRLRLLALAAVVPLASAVPACVNAPESATGGDFLFDAEAPINTSPHDAGTGSKWSDLYRDFFGPTGQASCTTTGDCHGTMDQSGARAIGFVCGQTKDDCYMSMLTSIVPPGGTPAGARIPAESTVLYQNVRKIMPANGAPQGTMPRSSTFAFSPADLQRIAAWMNAGALNDDATAGPDAGTDGGAADAPTPTDAPSDASLPDSPEGGSAG
jgi:hypothetical protein